MVAGEVSTASTAWVMPHVNNATMNSPSTARMVLLLMLTKYAR